MPAKLCPLRHCDFQDFSARTEPRAVAQTPGATGSGGEVRMAEKSTFPSPASYRLSTQDATFIYGESQSGPLHIGSIGLFEGRVDFNALLGHFEERMHLVPRYRQRLIEVPLNFSHAMMEDDPEFAVENHVFLHELPEGISEADALAEMMRVYQEAARSQASAVGIAHVPQPRRKSHGADVEGASLPGRWRVGGRAAEGDVRFSRGARRYPAAAGTVGRGAAVEHDSAIRGGACAIRFNAQLTRQSTRRSKRSRTRRRWRSARGSSREASRVMTELATRRIVATPWNSTPVTQDRVVAWTRQSFSDFRAIRSAFGGSVNDVVLAMLTEGAARYLQHHGYAVEGQQLCIGCPVNVRHKAKRVRWEIACR